MRRERWGFGIEHEFHLIYGNEIHVTHREALKEVSVCPGLGQGRRQALLDALGALVDPRPREGGEGTPHNAPEAALVGAIKRTSVQRLAQGPLPPQEAALRMRLPVSVAVHAQWALRVKHAVLQGIDVERPLATTVACRLYPTSRLVLLAAGRRTFEGTVAVLRANIDSQFPGSPGQALGVVASWGLPFASLRFGQLGELSQEFFLTLCPEATSTAEGAATAIAHCVHLTPDFRRAFAALEARCARALASVVKAPAAEVCYVDAGSWQFTGSGPGYRQMFRAMCLAQAASHPEDPHTGPIETDRASATPLFEVKTTRFQNVAAREAVAELRAREAELLEALDPFYATLTPLLGPLRQCEQGAAANLVLLSRRAGAVVLDGPFKEYTGSYHFWLTPPHRGDVGAFAAATARLASSLQWLEPLLMACYMTGDPVPAPSAPRGSYRASVNSVAGFGTADVGRLFLDEGTTGADFEGAFDTLRDLRRYLAGEATYSFTRFSPGDRVGVTWRRPDGSGARLTACRTQGRARTEDRSELEPFRVAGPVDARLRRGSDIRLSWGWCDNFIGRLKPGWTPYLVLRGKRAARAVFARGTEVTARAPLAEGRAFPMGLEFRVMDHFPSSSAAFTDLVRILGLLMVRASSAGSGHCQANLGGQWSAAMQQAFERGCQAELPEGYVKAVLSCLGARAKAPLGPRGVLQAVVSALHRKHGASVHVTGSGALPRVPDLNRGALLKHAADIARARRG